MKHVFFLILSLLVISACSDKEQMQYSLNVCCTPLEGGSTSLTSGLYIEGERVSIKATPAADYVFSGWSGSVSGSDNPLNIVMTSNMNITANFTKKSYPLTVTIEGGGHVEERIIATRGNYDSGVIIRLTAIPDEFWKFDHWEGDLKGNEFQQEIVITSDKSIKAVFIEQDPGIVFTETEYVSPEGLFQKLGLGIKMIGQLESNISSSGIISESNPKVTLAYFEKLKEEGFKTVCIPVTWLGKVGPAPDYIIDKEWLERIAEVVGYAEKCGLNVSIDLSYDSVNNLSEIEWLDVSDDVVWLAVDKAAKDPIYRLKSKEKLYAVWKQIAKRFRDKSDFLMFHCFTEPGVLWDFDLDISNPEIANQIDVLNERYQVFVDAVRSTGGNNASRWLVISPSTDMPSSLPYIKMPIDYVSNNRIIYSFHFFEPGAFTKDGICDQWGYSADVAEPSVYIRDEKYIESLFKSINSAFIKKGIPVVMTEFGCTNRSTELAKAYQLYWFEYVIKAARENIIPAYLLDCGAPEDLLESEYLNGFIQFGHSTGKYLAYGKEIIDTAMKAMYDDNPEYTLQSIYDKAPQKNKVDDFTITFADKVFEDFILSKYDLNSDGFISGTEAKGISEIDICTDNIYSLSGIEKMPNLKRVICQGSGSGIGKLSSVDFSNNLFLEDVCLNYNMITSINLKGCTALKTLACWDNNLSVLDVSSCISLTELYCAQNKIASFDFSNNTNLRNLAFNDNKITSVDLSNQTLLKILECGGNLLQKLDVSECTLLESLVTAGSSILSTIVLPKGLSTINIEKDDHTQIEYK